jgi:hypothetical protein
MCYYNGQKVSRSEFIRLMHLVKAVSNFNLLNVGVHNGFNYAPCAILVPTEDGKDFDIVQAEWDYVPGFIKTRAEANIFRAKYTTLNFKSENLFVKEDGKRSMWAGAAKNRRGLVLSTGIVESRHLAKELHRTLHRTKIKNPCNLLNFSQLQGFKVAGAGLEPTTFGL